MTAAEPFQLRGVNHLALVCRDMARTVDFYTNVLGMPLIKTYYPMPEAVGADADPYAHLLEGQQ